MLAGVFSYQLGGETYETAGKLLLCSMHQHLGLASLKTSHKAGWGAYVYCIVHLCCLAYWILDARLVSLDTPGLDYLIQFGAVSFCLPASQ